MSNAKKGDIMTDIEKNKSTFTELRGVNVGEYIEKKGNFSYLSWAWAVDQLLQYDVTANWEYGEPKVFPDGTMMIYCTVTAFGMSRTMQMPVLNHLNKPIQNPNAFEVNTAMQRCLVKAIALHGLGLYIYAGEDLPDGANVFESPKLMNQWVNNASKALKEAATLDALKETFALYGDKLKELAHGTDVEQVAYQEVVKAKDARKIELTKQSADKIVNDTLADILPESNLMAG